MFLRVQGRGTAGGQGNSSGNPCCLPVPVCPPLTLPGYPQALAWHHAMASQDDMPGWVKDLDFLTEPLEGNKAYFILQNAQRLRTFFDGRPGKIGQLFSIYDRHPPDTALDPQSGVLYFIRTEEGLQVRPIWFV